MFLGIFAQCGCVVVMFASVSWLLVRNTALESSETQRHNIAQTDARFAQQRSQQAFVSWIRAC